MSKLWRILFLTSFFVVFVVACSGPPSGSSGTTSKSSETPSKSQIINDWKETLASTDSRCLGDVKFKEVNIIGISVNGNVAEVLINVTGDWIGTRGDLGWYPNTACGGFKGAAGQNQVVKKKFIYKKYDSGWRFERLQWGT